MMLTVLLQESLFSIVALRHWHFTRYCSEKFDVWWDV